MLGAGATLLSNMDKAPTQGELTDFISNPLKKSAQVILLFLFYS